MHCRIFSSILGLYPTDESDTASSKCEDQKCLYNIAKRSLRAGGQNQARFTTTASRKCEALLTYTKINHPLSRLNVPRGCLFSCLHICCPRQWKAIYFRLVKNSVLKFHSCFNSFCFKPSAKHNYSSDLKTKKTTMGTGKCTLLTCVLIQVLKHAAGA